MRLYDHYRLRWHQSPRSRKKGDPPPPPPDPTWLPGHLCPDDRWTAQYFEDGSLESLDRQRFGVAAD